MEGKQYAWYPCHQDVVPLLQVFHSVILPDYSKFMSVNAVLMILVVRLMMMQQW